MSQHLVDKTDIDALVTAALQWCGQRTLLFDVVADDGSTTSGSIVISRENADELGRLLWADNYWYSGWGDYDQLHEEETDDEDVLAIRSYTFEELPGRPDPIVILHGIDYYVYQTQAESTDEWVNTIAFVFTHRLRDEAISRLPGYDRVPWGFEGRRDIFLTWAAEHA